MAFLPVIAAVAGIAGTAVSFMGAMSQASAAKAAGQAAIVAANYKAAQERQNADIQRAAASRSALEKVREGQLLQSKLIARAAASGGSASDPTVTTLGGDIAARSEYETLGELWKGEVRAQGLENQAQADIYSGAVENMGDQYKAKGAIIGGIGTAFSNLGGMASKFGGYG